MSALTARHMARSLSLLAGLLLIAMFLGLVLGSSPIDLRRALAGWLDSTTLDADETILVHVRLPRVLLASLVGGTLAAVGAAFQAMLKNPLADPYILGVSGGASVGVAVANALGLAGTLAGLSTLFTSAFVGALGAVAVIYLVAALLPAGTGGRYLSYTLLLTGVVFNAFAMAFVLLLQAFMSPIDSQRLLFWLMGSLSAPGGLSREFWTAASCMLLGSSFLVASARQLNLLALGDDTAMALGVRTSATRFALFACASLAVGGAVAVSGMIGFVGLVVPHALRLWLGADNRLLVPASWLGGAAFLVLADLLSRLAFPLAQTALPVGVVTAFVGVPLFFFFLIRNLRHPDGSPSL
ncbi:MAG: iron ABC transporter permease [Bradymonadales bacterium]|nr:iron ABC transporter permease [Bradymonadales bacterium]